MPRRLPAETDVMSDSAAARLLDRASQLDAARKGGLAVADLRAAATEAGISQGAFDAALAELQAAEQTPVPAAGALHRNRLRTWAIVASIALVTLTFLVGSMTVVRVSSGPVPVPDTRPTPRPTP